MATTTFLVHSEASSGHLLLPSAACLLNSFTSEKPPEPAQCTPKLGRNGTASKPVKFFQYEVEGYKKWSKT